MSALELAVSWVLSIITTVYNPGDKIYYKDAQETVEEAEARVNDIAGDVVEVVYNPETKPLFLGEYGRVKTAALVAAVMTNESGFRKDVDYGLGPYSRGDGGRSWCLMQLNIGKKRTIKWNWVQDRIPKWNDLESEIFEGYYGQELVTDRRLCIVEGMKLMSASMKACKRLPLQQRLAGYVIGSCSNPDGYPGSEDRFATAMRWYNARATMLTKFIENKIGECKDGVPPEYQWACNDEDWKSQVKFNDEAVLAGWAEWQQKRHSYPVSSKTLAQVVIDNRQ
jgi:hypothetical protein